MHFALNVGNGFSLDFAVIGWIHFVLSVRLHFHALFAERSNRDVQVVHIEIKHGYNSH